MAKKLMRAPRAMNRQRSNQRSVGQKPTVQQKLIYIADQLGLTGIKDQQGSSVNLFDTQILNTSTGRQTLDFFNNTSNKSLNFSNFQTGVLKAGETLVIEEVAFLLLALSAADLTAPTTAVTAIYPLAMAAASTLVQRPGVNLGMIDIDIANSTVVKDYLAYEQLPMFNPSVTGISPSTIDVAGVATVVDSWIGPSRIKMEAPPVVPPNNGFTLSYSIPPVGTVTANTAIMCVVGRFGSIFSGKTNY
jgi:hypothetical protein